MIEKKEKTKTVLKECCVECGFPIDMEREPIILDNNPLSYASYKEGKCNTCGSQKSGWTIKSVYKHIQKNMKNKTFRKERGYDWK